MSATDFVQGVEKRETRVGIVGLGYVGLPLALTFARTGFRVLGLDIDPSKTDAIASGQTYLKHIPSDDLAGLVEDKKLEATTDFSRVGECDALLLAVPTPLDSHRQPDMTYIEATARQIAPHLAPDTLVVLESTTYPGTTDDLLKALLEEGSGLSADKDFWLAYSPEREDPGNPNFNTKSIPKVVGGYNDPSLNCASALYGAALDEVVEVNSTSVAEMSKLLENIFRGVNIALVNELKVLCHRMDVDIWEVIRAASSKPFGFMKFTPGPGLGGHCIPIDPFYLSWKAREYGMSTRFIELAGEINTGMPRYVVHRLASVLNEHAKALRGSKVLVLGLAYKPNVDDVRESPAFEIIELLEEMGAHVDYHDPHVASTHRMRKHDLQMSSVAITPDALASYDAALVVTDHKAIDFDAICADSKLVLDTRRACDPSLENVYQA